MCVSLPSTLPAFYRKHLRAFALTVSLTLGSGVNVVHGGANTPVSSSSQRQTGLCSSDMVHLIQINMMLLRLNHPVDLISVNIETLITFNFAVKNSSLTRHNNKYVIKLINHILIYCI